MRAFALLAAECSDVDMNMKHGCATEMLRCSGNNQSLVADATRPCCAAAAAGLSTYAMVLLVFRRKIRDAPELEEDIDPTSLLRDK